MTDDDRPLALHEQQTSAPAKPALLRGFGQFSDAVTSTFVPLQAQAQAQGRDGFRAKLTTATIGAVQVTDLIADAHVVARTDRLIQVADPASYKLGLQVAGYSVLAQDGREAALTPGDFAIYDTSRPYQFAFDDTFRMLVVMFPKRLLRLPQEGMSELTARRVSGRQGLGALVSPFLHGLGQQLGTADTIVGMHLSEAVLDLLAAAFAEQLEVEAQIPADSRRRALMLRVHAHIEDRLADPGLSPELVARSQHISVRYLQKLFAGEGKTVMGWVRERRLERCRRDLTDPRLSAKPVAAVAASWGLPDASHFSRLFRDTYGLTPSEYRLNALAGAAGHPPA